MPKRGTKEGEAMICGGTSYWDYIRVYDTNRAVDGIQLDLTSYEGDCGGFPAWEGNCDEIGQMGPAFELVRVTPSDRKKICGEISGTNGKTRNEILVFLVAQLTKMVGSGWFVTGLTKYEKKTKPDGQEVYCKVGEPSGPCIDKRRSEDDPFVEKWVTPSGKEQWCASLFFCLNEKELKELKDKYNSLKESTQKVIAELTEEIAK